MSARPDTKPRGQDGPKHGNAKKKNAPGAGRKPRVPGERIISVPVGIPRPILDWIADMPGGSRSSHVARILRAAMDKSRQNTTQTPN